MEFIDLKTTAASIADWYAQHRRDLPWRQGKDPYRIWISEIMLQQTRIEAVIPYYGRFLSELPDVAALAAVPEDRLLKLWEGLGYYSRARNLKKAAQTIMAEYSGQMPRTAAELRKLPGIGDYTAGAIASIAFGEPEPAVDGNVMRVLARLSASEEDILSPGARKAASASLREIYPSGEKAAMLTEGLMELGERVCIPNGTPLCGDCPCKAFCKGHALGIEAQLPVRAEKKARKIEEKTVLVLRCGDQYALEKRPPKGLLAGLWGFPVLDGVLTPDEIQSRFDPISIRPLGKAKHIFTHIEWHMTGYLVECKNADKEYIWLQPVAIKEQYSIPKAFHNYLSKI